MTHEYTSKQLRLKLARLREDLDDMRSNMALDDNVPDGAQAEYRRLKKEANLLEEVLEARGEL